MISLEKCKKLPFKDREFEVGDWFYLNTRPANIISSITSMDGVKCYIVGGSAHWNAYEMKGAVLIPSTKDMLEKLPRYINVKYTNCELEIYKTDSDYWRIDYSTVQEIELDDGTIEEDKIVVVRTEDKDIDEALTNMLIDNKHLEVK